MDNQDLTLERRLKARDKLIAELLEALEKIARFGTNQLHPHSDLLLVQVWANEAIRKAKGE